MFRANPLIARLAIAKSLGFLYGLIWLLVLPADLPEVGPYLPWGALLWFTTMGGIIGMVGLFDRHPLWPAWRLTWWLIAETALVGAAIDFLSTRAGGEGRALRET